MSDLNNTILEIGNVEIATLKNLAAFPHDAPLAVLNRPINGLNILTTQSTKSPEFYGWGSPIAKHKDGSGFMFFMPYYMDHEEYLCNEFGKVKIEKGGVYMLDDRIEHWTEGEGFTLAVFCGSYKEVTQDIKDHVMELFSNM